MWLQQHPTMHANIGSHIEEDVVATIGEFGHPAILFIDAHDVIAAVIFLSLDSTSFDGGGDGGDLQ